MRVYWVLAYLFLCRHALAIWQTISMLCLICPICAESFVSNPQGVRCHNHHQFDRAKEGYLNLLPVQHKHSREPGDAKQQLDARRHFLSEGIFDPLKHAMLQLIPNQIEHLLDIGCGEGYFTRAIAAHCATADVYGIDISKQAVRLAAKSSPSRITYAVASSYALPLANHSVDMVVRIYAPSKQEELERVIKTNGQVLIVTPGADHLIGLRKTIYQEIRPHPSVTPLAGFVEVERQSIEFDFQLTPGNLTQSLLTMTPFVWRLKQETMAGLVSSGLTDRGHFQLSLYQRT